MLRPRARDRRRPTSVAAAPNSGCRSPSSVASSRRAARARRRSCSHEAEAKPQVTVIVDDERMALQEAVAAEVRRPLTSIIGLALALSHADPKTYEGCRHGQAALDERPQARPPRRRDARPREDRERRVRAEPATHRPRGARAPRGRGVARTSRTATSRSRPTTWRSRWTPRSTEQMVETLLANAGRRTTPGNPVWVKVSSGPEGGVDLAVDDTGPEVPAGLRGAMFAAVDGAGSRRSAGKPRGATGLSLLARLAVSTAAALGSSSVPAEAPRSACSFRRCDRWATTSDGGVEPARSPRTLDRRGRPAVATPATSGDAAREGAIAADDGEMTTLRLDDRERPPPRAWRPVAEPAGPSPDAGVEPRTDDATDRSPGPSCAAGRGYVARTGRT